MALSSRTVAAVCSAGAVLLATALGPDAASHQAHAKSVTIALVPRLITSAYYHSMRDAGLAYCKAHGCTFLYQGPLTGDAVAQIGVIKRLIAQHVGAIIVAPDSPSLVAPALKQAEAQGIKILTGDTDAAGSVRRVFVSQGLAEQIGGATIDALAKGMSDQGDWAIDSCSPSAQNLNSWIAVEREKALKMYPKMHLIAQFYSGDSTAKSVADTKALITGHPTLQGVLGQCDTAAPGVAQAVTDLHKIGTIVATGVSWPGLMRPYIKNGATPAFPFWDVYKLGLLSAWAADQLIHGRSFAATNNVPGVGPAVAYDPATKNLLLGKPIVFNKSNIDKASDLGHIEGK